ncbi:MAG: uroporphyrinogen-III C-methyltransferase, partial [Ruminococcus sp.]|nr:uroporphyrinogen-III C-methyltransferase [Ruminococcus sp.]
MGKVTLVGAGCGKGLITVKGIEKLKEADVIVYDDLIDQNLLSVAKDECELIYVGKRIGKHSENQQKINEILIEQAQKVNAVVRLKGGDSFVFGRGGEEIIAMKNAGVEFEVIPGVSSAIAVPEQFGIPVTHRGAAQSFTVVTGHTATQNEENYAALAKLKGTLVFLMGLHNASHISSELIANGKAESTPCAILSDGFGANSKRINCTLKTLPEAAKQAHTPAVIVVGETAMFDFSKTLSSELSGVSVTVTGTKQFTKKLSKALENEGAYVTAYPYLEISPLKDVIPADLAVYDWLIFTSANGVDVFFDCMKKRNVDFRSFTHLKFACIGKGSAQKLREHGFNADFIPSTYTAKALGEQLAQHVKSNERLLI